MTEKAVVLSSRTAKTKTGSILAGGAWAAAGLLMEVSSGGGSVGASALAAGVTAANGIWIYAGGIVGALLKGFPGGYIGIGGLAIVLAGRLIPQVRNVRIKCVIQGLLAAAAAFFSACAEYTSPSALLSGIISAFTAGIFAACVLLLYDRASVRGFDISDYVARKTSLRRAPNDSGRFVIEGGKKTLAEMIAGCLQDSCCLPLQSAKAYRAPFWVSRQFAVCAFPAVRTCRESE